MLSSKTLTSHSNIPIADYSSCVLPAMVRRVYAVNAVTIISLFLVSSAVSQSLDLPEGAPCRTKTGENGRCTLETSCESEIKRRVADRNYRPIRCGFKDFTPIVCCSDAGPVAVTTAAPVAVMQRKAVKACHELDAQVNSTFTYYIFDGIETFKGEFPHMVAVGYQDEYGGKVWECGGSLISEQFVLTAAHCVYNTRRGAPDSVRVGVHNLSRSDEGRELRVLQAIVHPSYKVQSHYNDVALLKIPNVKFDELTIPACLYAKMDTPKVMVVTGWGSFDEDISRKSDVLLKADLVPIPTEKCNSSFQSRAFKSKLSRGIASDMICARGANNMSDTCGGDSGGPIQASRNGNIPFTVVGVTSFGAFGCGAGTGVYARVASFLDWIESHVWPD